MIASRSSFKNMASSTWLLDLRASHHLTFDSSYVPNSTSFLSNKGITISDDNKLLIASIGSGALHTSNYCSFSFNNLLHSPNAFSNLLYMQKLCSYNLVIIKFQFDSFSIKDINT